MTSPKRPRLRKLGPGETRTKIVVWDIHDPAKKDDPGYWWDERDAAQVRALAPDMPDLSGRPRGNSLAGYIRRGDSEEIELPFPGLDDGVETETLRVSLRHFGGSDPERTFLIVTQEQAPTEEESKEIKARGLPWPDEVETLRQEWLAALAANEHERAAELSEQLDAAFEEHGFSKPTRTPLLTVEAVEIQPGVFLQDERPGGSR